MIAFPSMLIGPATQADMKVPSDPEEFDRNEFPHFEVFLTVQLGKAMRSPSEHWSNAKAIAAIPEDKIREVTVDDLTQLYDVSI